MPEPTLYSQPLSSPQLGMQPQHSSRTRGRGWLKWLFILIVLAAGAWWLFGHHGATDDAVKGSGAHRDKHGGASTPVVSVALTARADIPVYLDALGTIQAYNNVVVHAQVDGQLLKINFVEGQDVKAGAVLAEIDPRLFQAAYDQAAANQKRDAAQLTNTRQDLERYAGLGNAIAQQTVDTQRAAVRQAEAAVAADAAATASAKTQLGYTHITAPIDGRTGIRQVDVGNLVHASDATGIVTITQVQPISVLFSLPQQTLPQILKAQQTAATANTGGVTVLATDTDNKVLDTGTLVLVDNQIDQTTGTVRLKATLPNAQQALWPGAFTNVRLLADVLKNALYIPAAAIQRGPDSAYVFVFKPADHTVHMQPVETGITEDQVAVITKGLNDGDQIVTDNGGKLSDGAKVALPGETPPKDDQDQTGKHGDAPNEPAAATKNSASSNSPSGGAPAGQ